MSDIGKARELLQELLDNPEVDSSVKRTLRIVMPLLYREPYARKAPGKRRVIDREMRSRVKQMAAAHPEMTEFEIARRTGLGNQGRVSDVLHGRR